MGNKLNPKPGWTATCLLLAASTASGALLAYDNFDYPPGTTISAGETLGSATNGFSNAWKLQDPGLSGEVVSGLNFTGVESSGNALKISNDGNGRYLFRGMPSALTEGTYYMGMLFYRDDFNGGGSENWSWELKNSSSYTYGPGSSTKVAIGSTSGEQASILVAGGSTGTGTPTYNVGSTVFMLAKIVISDSGSETASMKWYNTGDAPPASDSEIVWDATSTGEFSGGAGWKFNLPKYIQSMVIDEFRLGTELADIVPVQNSFLPPPATLHVLEYANMYQIGDGETVPKYLSVDGPDSYTNNSPLRLLDGNGQPEQRWRVNVLEDGRFQIKADSAYYYVRANADGGWGASVPVQLQSWMDWDSQKWMPVPEADGLIALRVNGSFHLSSETETSGASIEAIPWQSEARQKWKTDLQDTVQSPYILRGTDGALLAFFKHSFPVSGNRGMLYASADDGQSWSLRTVFNQDIYGPTLFVQGGAIYMLYLDLDDGKKLQIKKSTDHGASWSNHEIRSFVDNLETGGGTDALVKDGILYYGFVDKGGSGGWPTQFRLRVASCPTNADPTVSSNWTVTDPLAFPSSPAVSGTRNGWLEPNCVAGPDGRVWVIARVDKTSTGDVAAVLKVSTDRMGLEFTNQYPAPGNETGFIDAPWAGSSKFHFVYDAVSGRHLVMSNPYLGSPSSDTRHPYVRNILALYETADLKNYRMVKTLVEDDSLEDWSQSARRTGFQYPGFIIDGSSLKYVCRTAYRTYDNYHDANMGTYHELEDFRSFLAPDGEVAYYPFDDADSPGFDFSKMRGADADVYGASFAADGRFGGALGFNGTNAWLGTMHRLSPKLHRSKAVALSVWIKNDSTSGTVFSSASDGSATGLELQMENGKLRMSARSQPSDSLQSREFGFTATNEWHHVVAQWDFENGAMRLWLDKVEQSGTGTATFGSPEYLRGAPAYQDAIGSHFGGGDFFAGKMDELHLYARSLDPAEIKALYDGPGYGEWAGEYALLGDASDDDDSDGLSNLNEYGLGGNPTNAADIGHPIAFQRSGSDFEYIYPRRNAPDAGLVYHIETATNLVSGNWTNGGYLELPIVGILDGEFDSVTNQLSVGDACCGFVRLLIERQ